MAEKHKSKYKKPENAKPTRRKDLKDYTYDDKVGALNPYSTGKKQERVARKTDKAIQDDGKLFPKYTDKDRLYKKIEDGEYDPKHAMNVLRKRQEVDTDDYFDAREKIDHGVTTSELKERISRLSPLQKEQLVREYIRRKIAKIIIEQTDTPEETPTPETPEEIPTPEAGAETPTAPDAPAAAGAPAPTAPDAPAPTTPTPAPTPTQAPAPQTNAPEGQNGEGEEQSKEEQESAALKKVVAALTKEAGAVGKVEFIVKAIRTVFKDAEPADTKNFYKLLNRVIIKKLNKMSADQSVKKD